MADLDLALAAAARARTLVADLDRSDTQADRHQVAAGVRHELDTILRVLHDAAQSLADDAAGNRAGKVRSDARETSRQAAALLLNPGSARVRILEALLAHRTGGGGLTDLELQEALKLDPSTERPRRGELVDAGLVQEARITRVHNGRKWTVWRITERGQQALITLAGDKPGATSVVADVDPTPTLF
jgi:hypothetical protein